MKTGIGI
jgi:hypothetical protein